MMRDKLGLFGEDKGDLELINNLLNWMKTNQVDYTNTFCKLMNANFANQEIYNDKNFINWVKNWEKRILINGRSKKNSLDLMKKNNPFVIPRNHIVEEALTEANRGNLEKMNKFLEILRRPYENRENIIEYQIAAPISNIKYQTFCGT